MPGPQEIFIMVLAFDKPSLFPLEEHVHYVKRVEWVEVVSGLCRLVPDWSQFSFLRVDPYTGHGILVQFILDSQPVFRG